MRLIHLVGTTTEPTTMRNVVSKSRGIRMSLSPQIENTDVSEHGDQRSVLRSGAYELSTKEMWRQGSFVDVEGQSGRTRMHDKAGVILVARNGVITTALRAEHESTYSPHLTTCDSCGYEYCTKEHGLTCPYCGFHKEINIE